MKDVQKNKVYRGQIFAQKTLEKVEGKTVDSQSLKFTEGRDFDNLHSCLNELCKDGLWRHQARILENYLQNRPSIILRSYNSGVSEILDMLMIHKMTDEQKSSLVISATREAAQARHKQFIHSMQNCGFDLADHINLYTVHVDDILGDPVDIDNMSILFTTAEVISYALLPELDQYRDFFLGLDIVLLDCADSYQSIFGENCSFLFRELFRSVEAYKRNPFIVMSMEPYAAVDKFFYDLTGQGTVNGSIIPLNNDTKPSEEKEIYFWAPPLIVSERDDRGENVGRIRRNGLKQEIQTLVFYLTGKLEEEEQILLYGSGIDFALWDIGDRIDRNRVHAVNSFPETFMTPENLKKIRYIVFFGCPPHVWRLLPIARHTGSGKTEIIVLTNDDPLSQYNVRNLDRFLDWDKDVTEQINQQEIILGRKNEMLLANFVDQNLGAYQPVQLHALTGQHVSLVDAAREMDKLRGTKLYMDRFLLGTDLRKGIVFDSLHRKYQVTAVEGINDKDLIPTITLEQTNNIARQTLVIKPDITVLQEANNHFHATSSSTKYRYGSLDIDVIEKTIEIKNYADFSRSAPAVIEDVSETEFQHTSAIFATRGCFIQIDGFDRAELHGLEHLLYEAISHLIAGTDTTQRLIGSYIFEGPVPDDALPSRPWILFYERMEGGIGIIENFFEDQDKVTALFNLAWHMLYSCQCLEGCTSCLHALDCAEDNAGLNEGLKRSLLKKLGLFNGMMDIDRMLTHRYDELNADNRGLERVNRFLPTILKVFKDKLNCEIKHPPRTQFMTKLDEREFAGAEGVYIPSKPMVYLREGNREGECHGILAHEYFHHWQHSDGNFSAKLRFYDREHINHPLNIPFYGMLFVEGSANWGEIKVLDYYALVSIMIPIDQRRFDEYGEGFQVIKYIENRFGTGKLIEFLRDAEPLMGVTESQLLESQDNQTENKIFVDFLTALFRESLVAPLLEQVPPPETDDGAFLCVNMQNRKKNTNLSFLSYYLMNKRNHVYNPSTEKEKSGGQPSITKTNFKDIPLGKLLKTKGCGEKIRRAFKTAPTPMSHCIGCKSKEWETPAQIAHMYSYTCDCILKADYDPAVGCGCKNVSTSELLGHIAHAFD